MPIGTYDVKTITQLLSSNQILVPVFQRPFSWGKNEYGQFLEDLNTAMNESLDSYFIGSVFFKEKETISCYVIDGQQRLSAATILISLIRDMLYEHGDDRVPDVENNFIKKRDLKSRDIFYKISLGEINLDFFRQYIQEKDKPQNKITNYGKEKKVNFSNKLIFGCYKFYYTKIKEWSKSLDSKERVSYLIDMLSKLTENFYALSITINEETEAYTIFETLNDRGLDLAISDLLKNYLFSILHTKLSDSEMRTYLKTWDTMIENLGKYTSSFLKHYWNSKNKPISEKQIYRALKKSLKNKKDVLKFLNELSKEAEVYNGLIHPEFGYWGDKEIVSLLEEVSILGITQCFPLLLSTRAKFNDNDFKKVISSCIGLSFRYSTVCNFHNNLLERKYSNIANDIRKKKIKKPKAVSKALKPLWPKDDIYRELFLEMSFKSTSVPKYILRKINDKLDAGKEIVSSTSITLEHIIPKKSTEKEISALKKRGIDHSDEINKFRNMTILGEEYNRKASSEPFQKKIVMYNKSKLPINAKLKGFKKWTPEEISKWNKFLLDCSEQNWVL